MNKLLKTVLLLFISIDVAAQADSLHQNHQVYFGLGFGLGPGSKEGLFSDAYVYLQREKYYFEFKTSGIAKVNLFGDSPNLTVSELSLIVGKSYSLNKHSYFQFGTGVSLVNKISRGRFLYDNCDKPNGCLLSSRVYETIRQRPLGLPLETRLNLNLDRTAALSLSLSANINRLESFYGLSVGFVLGRLRDKLK
jgi:hypothetical protein